MREKARAQREIESRLHLCGKLGVRGISTKFLDLKFFFIVQVSFRCGEMKIIIFFTFFVEVIVKMAICSF